MPEEALDILKLELLAGMSHTYVGTEKPILALWENSKYF